MPSRNCYQRRCVAPVFECLLRVYPPFLSHLFQRPLLPFHLHFLYPCKCKRSAVLVAYTLLDIDNLSSVSVESATQFSTQQFVHTLARLFLQGGKKSIHPRIVVAQARLIDCESSSNAGENHWSILGNVINSKKTHTHSLLLIASPPRRFSIRVYQISWNRRTESLLGGLNLSVCCYMLSMMLVCGRRLPVAFVVVVSVIHSLDGRRTHIIRLS